MVLAAEIIRRKRDGATLSSAEIEGFFNGLTSGAVADYQASALLMASCIKGLADKEIEDLTRVMVSSGKTLKWDYSRNIVADKHSTGGIGDKVSLILLPLACLEGLKVPMMSGRALGHTGGTLDKLESIPGINVRLSEQAARTIVERWGGVFIGQTDQVAPLDKKLYALRDVTGTVESVGLITASILSKKVAEGIGTLVMDVKVGSGAFLRENDQAWVLAKSLHRVGKLLGLNMSCVLSDMDSPLGRTAGNSLEVDEAIEVLKGGGDHRLKELTLTLVEKMLTLSQGGKPAGDIRSKLEGHLESGRAYDLFDRIVSEQGGSLVKFNQRKTSPKLVELPLFHNRSKSSSAVASIDVRQIGVAVIALGGGRQRVNDEIDHEVGIKDLAHVGQRIGPEEPFATIVARDKSTAEDAARIVRDAYRWSDAASIKAPDLIRGVLE